MGPHVILLVLMVAQPIVALRMFSTFSDNGVLQYDKPAIHGFTNHPNTAVTIQDGTKPISATSDADGLFVVQLTPRTMGDRVTISVKADDANISVDLLFGDVFLCSGQSNMVHPVSYDYQAAKEIADATYPNVRLMQVGRQYSATPKSELACEDANTTPNLTPSCATGTRNLWHRLNGTTVSSFSAVCYFTLEQVMLKYLGTNATIGLIESDWGGSPQEAWISENSAKHYQNGTCLPTSSKLDHSVITPIQSPNGLGLWPTSTCNASFGCLLNGMIYPLSISTNLKAILWYQGESDSNPPRYPAADYECYVRQMVGSWRTYFRDPTIGFYIVQLAPYWQHPIQSSFPSIRIAQDNVVMSTPNCGLSVTHDIGDIAGGIHPHNKVEVGKRLSAAVLNITFGQATSWKSPHVVNAMQSLPGAVSLDFTDTYGGTLTWKPTNNCTTCCEPQERSIDVLVNDQWVSGSLSEVSHNATTASFLVTYQGGDAFRVRYAWSNFPQCVLFNDIGLTAGPFVKDVMQP